MTAARLALTVILTLGLLGGPLGVEAQQAHLYRVGVLMQGGPAARAAVDGLRDGFKELGLEEGKHYVLHVRDARGDLKAVEAAAKSLEAEKVDLIYALATSVTLAAKRATTSVPIVFYAGTDPVAMGLVESFRKPGGRLTGFHIWTTDLTAKRLELMKEILPKLRRVVGFYNPRNPAAQESIRLARDAARQLKVEILERPVASVEELRAALRALRPGEADAHLHIADAMVSSHAELIIDAARAKRLPTIFTDRESAVRGALASYGTSYYVVGRLSAKLVQRVLLGANPADMPVEQLDRLYLTINLKTAKAIGVTIPQAVLARADEIIE